MSSPAPPRWSVHITVLQPATRNPGAGTGRAPHHHTNHYQLVTREHTLIPSADSTLNLNPYAMKIVLGGQLPTDATTYGHCMRYFASSQSASI